MQHQRATDSNVLLLQQSARPNDRQLGVLLIDAKRITAEDALRVLQRQTERGGLFGESAIALGLVSQADIDGALAQQYNYPYLVTRESPLSRDLVAAFQPFSRQVEMLRALRTQLMLRWINVQRKHFAVISPARGDGRSYLAANLAIVFAQLGERTLLIDADLRHGRQHTLFGLELSSGLSSYLSGRIEQPALHRIDGLTNLTVVNAGPRAPNPQELISRAAFLDLLESAAEQFDVVILDTPAAEIGADAQAIAVAARGALLVARQHRTRLRSVDMLSAAIVSTGGAVIGSVLARH